MSPILGTVASSISGNLGSYYLIDSFVATDNTTTAITFSSIPQTYAHLELRYATRGTANVGGGTSVGITLNNDNSANYTYHAFLASANTGLSNTSRSTGNTVAYAGVVEGHSNNALASNIALIQNYSSSSKLKTVRSFASQVWSGNAGYVFLGSAGYFGSTNAITSIKIDQGGAASPFFVGTIFSLYGIKGE